jgi:hypothetical protein
MRACGVRLRQNFYLTKLKDVTMTHEKEKHAVHQISEAVTEGK